MVLDRRRLIAEISAQVFDALERSPPDGVTADEVRAFRAAHEAAQRASLYEQFKHLGAPPAAGRDHGPPTGEDENAATAAAMLDAARRALDEPEARWAWQAALDARDGVVRDGLDELDDFEDLDDYDDRWTLDELAEVPLVAPDGRALTAARRRDLALLAFDLAMGEQGRGDPDDTFELGGSGEHARHAGRGFGMPRWLAEAVLADALLPRAKLRLVPVSREQAVAFIRRHHSKLPRLNERGLLFLVGAARGGRLVAVAAANTPSGRWADPHGVVEVSRIASDGTVKGAASKLMARILDVWQRAVRYEAAPALLVTYSLSSEDGTTYTALKDRGLRPTVKIPGREPGGARAGGADGDVALARIDKVRWEAGPAAAPADWSLIDPHRRKPATKTGPGGD